MVLYFLLSVLFLVLVTISRKLDVSIALAVAALFYGFASLGLSAVSSFFSAFNYSMASVLTSLIFAMALGFLLKERREDISSGLIGLGSRSAAFAIPAVIGLLPMPGGAYVSAVVAEPLYDQMGLKPHEKTFLNYWMRHIWISTWPLFQGVLITSAVLEVPVTQVLEWSWPATLLALAVGVALGIPMLRKVSVQGKLSRLVVLWPLLLIAILFLFIPLPLAVVAVYLLYIAVYRIPKSLLAASFKYALNPRILTIIIFSLVFAQFIKDSGLGGEMAASLGNAAPIAIFLIPFAIGVATGLEFAFASLAFPPIAGLIHGPTLAVAFTGGFLGVMLSPAHSCLVLTVEHYKADLAKVYRLLAIAGIVSAALTAVYSLLLIVSSAVPV